MVRPFSSFVCAAKSKECSILTESRGVSTTFLPSIFWKIRKAKEKEEEFYYEEMYCIAGTYNTG